jgi:hypothetical protein
LLFAECAFILNFLRPSDAIEHTKVCILAPVEFLHYGGLWSNLVKQDTLLVYQVGEIKHERVNAWFCVELTSIHLHFLEWGLWYRGTDCSLLKLGGVECCNLHETVLKEEGFCVSLLRGDTDRLLLQS